MMKHTVVILFAVLFISLGLNAAFLERRADAAELYGSSETIPYVYQYYENDEGTQRFSLFEYANVHAQKFGVRDLTLHMGGWGRWDAVGKDDEDQQQPGDADLIYAYLQWNGFEGMADVIAGRHFIVAGPTAERMDGLDVALRPFAGFTLRGFAGVPAVSKIGERDGDYGWGGRISYAYKNYFEIGAGANTFLEETRLDRRNAGGDLSVTPCKYFDISGHAFVDTIFSEIYDAGGLMNIYPLNGLRFQGSYSHIVPAAFLGQTSYFSVFSAETIDKAEGELAYLIKNRVRIIGAYSQYAYDEGDDATRPGGGAELLWGLKRENSLGLRYYRLDKKDNGYDELRGFLFQKVAKVAHVAVNAAQYQLDDKIYNVDQSFDGDLSLGWQVSKRLSVQATGVYRSTPYYESDYRALMKIGYNVERSF